MYDILIIIHAIVTVSLIVIILMQRSSADGNGLSGGSSSNSFMSGRAAATFLTRTTSLLGAVFILLSLGIGVLTAHNSETSSGSIMDKIEGKKIEKPVITTPVKKEESNKPSVPRPE